MNDVKAGMPINKAQVKALVNGSEKAAISRWVAFFFSMDKEIRLNTKDY
ncbi:hypothetical protein LJR015_000865 [Peribacillus frigoritolerans]